MISSIHPADRGTFQNLSHARANRFHLKFRSCFWVVLLISWPREQKFFDKIDKVLCITCQPVSICLLKSCLKPPCLGECLFLNPRPKALMFIPMVEHAKAPKNLWTTVHAVAVEENMCNKNCIVLVGIMLEEKNLQPKLAHKGYTLYKLYCIYFLKLINPLKNSVCN